MKIIFDSEEQKENFNKYVINTHLAIDYCPSCLNLDEACSVKVVQAGSRSCSECWKNCGIEMEVKCDET